MRAQPFDGPGLFQHFRIFALLSSGRDRGSGSTEAAMLTAHLRYWIDAITATVPDVPVRAEFTSFGSAVLSERFRDTVLPALQPLPDRVSIGEDPTRDRARGYYGSSGAIRVTVGERPEVVEIGDGGFTDWTGQLMADNKERCLISCIATERLGALVEDHACRMIGPERLLADVPNRGLPTSLRPPPPPLGGRRGPRSPHHQGSNGRAQPASPPTAGLPLRVGG